MCTVLYGCVQRGVYWCTVYYQWRLTSAADTDWLVRAQQSAADNLTCHIRVISTLIKYNGGRITKLIINVTVITTPEA